MHSVVEGHCSPVGGVAGVGFIEGDTLQVKVFSMNFKVECSHRVVDECELADVSVRRKAKDLDCLLKIWSVEIEVVAWEGERRGGEGEWREEGKGREGERRGGKEYKRWCSHC